MPLTISIRVTECNLVYRFDITTDISLGIEETFFQNVLVVLKIL